MLAPSALLSNAAAAEPPLVTIVALCHNHVRFLAAALNSIAAQTYPHLEIWLVDDASTDGSPEVLRRYAAQHPEWHLLLLPHNVGNCQAFNQALRQSRGAFVIDFATDDVLLPERVARQVTFMQAQGPRCGVAYHDCELIDEQGQHVRYHFRRDAQGRPVHPVPAAGDVFAEVLRRYFISTPTMMFSRPMLADLGGYDEALAYEDFDLWVRASRNWQFGFQDEVLTQKRLHPQSMSRKAYRPADPYVASTIRVCEKALAMCRTPHELAALATRLRWELRQAVRFGNGAAARRLFGLLRQTRQTKPLDYVAGALGLVLK
ncbi:glycosyltransferase family 2 protein [Hymenobacter oligotrophus]|uniref:Glycosyltransferase family 2 protein n=1 Tax=Hymenobacter oligotrophus TaxID=2319843 RepID=A0A3B7R5D3_9BACT|nr:glycosyltransferase family A protein [Hymenobacter oligotrophus]AYA36591.1 glycosyltransferase family 2 protein [Hymenobacter oligotrophus]